MAKTRYFTTSLSFPDEALYWRAKERAAAMGISFSRFVCLLLEQDFQMRNETGSIKDLISHDPKRTRVSDLTGNVGTYPSGDPFAAAMNETDPIPASGIFIPSKPGDARPRRRVLDPDNPKDIETIAKMGIVAAGLQPHAEPPPSAKAALTTGSESGPNVRSAPRASRKSLTPKPAPASREQKLGGKHSPHPSP